MKANEVTIEVKANLSISKETAETCLKLVEMYINQNSVCIIGNKMDDGTTKFEFLHDKR